MINDPLDLEKYTKKGAYHWMLWRKDRHYRWSVKKTLNIIASQETNKETKFIDFGCGDGLYTFLWAIQGYNNIVGIDLNDLAVLLAQKIDKVTWHDFKKLPKIEFKQGDFTSIVDTDVVFMFDVFEHLPNPEEVIVQLKNNCKRLYILNPEWSSENHVKLYRSADFYELFKGWDVQIMDSYYQKTLYRITNK